MPTYVYRCPYCEMEWEKRHPINIEPEIVCPKCDTLMAKKPVNNTRAYWKYGSRQKEEGRW